MVPKISIVTPSLNQADYLEKTILSVLDQNYPNLEYWIIDGGSTDGSLEIIKKYEDQLAGWISEPDEGQADGIEKGFARLSGDIFAWINSDDVYLPGSFHSAAEAFGRDPEAMLVYGDIVMVSSQDEPLAIDVLPRFNIKDLYRVCCIPQPASFWTRRAWEEVGGLDRNLYFSIDYDFFLRVAAIGKVIHIPRMMAAFRIHPEAKTARLQEGRARDDALLHRRYIGRDFWFFSDWLWMKWLTLRQIGEIVRRRLSGEKFPTYVPARWNRVARGRLG